MPQGKRIAAVLSVTLVTTMAQWPEQTAAQAAPAAQPAQQCSAAAATEAEAVEMAVACKRQVEITDATSQTSKASVLPSGTIRREISAAPVRVKQNDTWVPVDLDLVMRADGSVAPKAHPDNLTIAGARTPDGAQGADAVHDLAVLGEGASRVAMGWSGALPKPTLDRNKATYADVRPGVDLIVEATPKGVESFYIVKNKAAAAHVTELTVPLSGTSVASHRRAKDGAVTLLDGNGKTVAYSPAPLMWDARTDATGAPKHVRAMGSKATARVASKSALATANAGVDLALTPDATFMADPATVYPVTIDPTLNLDNPTWDTWVREATTSDQSTSYALQIGAFTNGNVARSFVNWDISALKGKHITSATTGFYNYQSNSCTNIGWEIWSVTGSDTNTRWTNQPTWKTKEGASTATKAGPNACVAAGTVYVNSTQYFQRQADEQRNIGYMGVRATDETNAASAKNFYSDNHTDATKAPFAIVDYQSFAVASLMSTNGDSGCTTGVNRPAIATATPVLGVQIDDPEGTAVQSEMELATLAGTTIATTTSPIQASGTTFTTTVPSGQLTNGQSYKWRSRGTDSTTWAPWTTWCEFTVNVSLPIVDPEDVNEPVPASLRDAVGVYDQLAEGNPNDLGYPHVVNNAIVVDAATPAGADKTEALADGTLPAPVQSTPTDPDVALTESESAIKAEAAAVESQSVVDGMAIDVQSVATNRNELDQLLEDVLQAADSDPALAAAGIWQTEIDRDASRVAITMDSVTSPAAQRLVQLFGQKVELIPGVNPANSDSVGRLADDTPFYGGARISVAGGGSCTTAFAWTITSTKAGMLTAGHCAPDGGTISTWGAVYQGTITSGSRENYSSTGTVYLPGQNVYRGDMALTTITAAKTSTPRIYQGAASSTTSRSVRGMFSRRAQKGDQFCTGGSYSGEVCGWTVDAAGVTMKVSGKWKRNVVRSTARQGWCIRPGDSGGPVYIVNADGSVSAMGIINSGGGGGSDFYGGALDKCSMQFTDIWEAYSGFPGLLKRG